MSKTTLTLISIACFTLTAIAADTWQKLGSTPSQKISPPRQLEQTEPPLPAQLIRAGFRRWDGAMPAIATNYERLAEGRFTQHHTQSNRCTLVFVDTLISARLAREAAEASAAAIAASNAAAERLEWTILRDSVVAIEPTNFPAGPTRETIRAIKQSLRKIIQELKPDL